MFSINLDGLVVVLEVSQDGDKLVKGCTGRQCYKDGMRVEYRHSKC